MATPPSDRPPHDKRLVIVTRPAPDGPRLMTALGDIGEDAHYAPVMDIAANDVAANLNGVAALAFTSANGVRAFAEKSAVRDLPAFTVGPATAAACREAGFERIAAAKGDVQSLATLIADKHQSEGDILHVAGVHRAGDLSGLLAEKSVPARRQVLYEARARERLAPESLSAIEEARTASRPIWVLFYSARSALLFVDQVEKAGANAHLAAMTAVCLRAPVAEAVAHIPWTRVLLADKTDRALADPVLHLMSQGIHMGAT